jgi:methylated-DNA-[protein]-cysteine S-methyltransferase
MGELQLVASSKGLRAVLFANGRNKFAALDGDITDEPEYPLLLKAEKQLAEYFTGRRKRFDLTLDIRGTVFQINTWRQLQAIPYRQTITYAQQAERLGDANKARAVGIANGRNPLAIVVPCHRVIGSDDGLIGFSGGLEIKQYLLKLEKQAAL